MPIDGGLTNEFHVGFIAERFFRAGDDFPLTFAEFAVLAICLFENIARRASSSTGGAISNDERVEEVLLKDGVGGGKNERLEAGIRSTVSVRRESEAVDGFGGFPLGLADEEAREFHVREYESTESVDDDGPGSGLSLFTPSEFVGEWVKLNSELKDEFVAKGGEGGAEKE